MTLGARSWFANLTNLFQLKKRLLIYVNETLATIPFSSIDLDWTRQAYTLKKMRYNLK